MRRPLVISALISLCLLGVTACAGGGTSETSPAPADLPTFSVQSPGITAGSALPEAQAGGGISPELEWSGLPADTRSIAVGMFDPDAPSPGFWHWLVIDLPADTTGLPAGSDGSGAAQLPSGARSLRNDAGSLGFTGAEPPSGETHRYQITVTALDVVGLDVPDDATAAEAAAVVEEHTIARAVLETSYTSP